MGEAAHDREAARAGQENAREIFLGARRQWNLGARTLKQLSLFSQLAVDHWIDSGWWMGGG
jgi:hypothetical protein